MKRKSIALLLALMMCLALLSACGGDNTPDTVEPPASGDTSTEQQPADGKEEQSSQEPEQGEPKQDPEESPELTQEEPKEEEHAGTAFLKLLREEYQNGFIRGERPGWSYCTRGSNGLGFIRDGVVYIWSNFSQASPTVFSYDIASKVLNQTDGFQDSNSWGAVYYEPLFIRNDSFYYTHIDHKGFWIRDFNGKTQKDFTSDTGTYFYGGELRKGILFQNGNIYTLYSYDFEKLAEIPLPQHEVAHGLTEDIKVKGQWPLDGTLYIQSGNNSSDFVYYRLNLDTYEWEECEKPLTDLDYFCGKYGYKKSVIYESTTGEQVFNCDEAGVYPPLDKYNMFSCYFGGDKYLGCSNNEIRWVNLTDLSMSDPLPFPEKSDELYVLNDTYCVYKDNYGWFLWNYNTGEEETIMMFNK